MLTAIKKDCEPSKLSKMEVCDPGNTWHPVENFLEVARDRTVFLKPGPR